MTEAVPSQNGIRWLRECHSKVAKNGRRLACQRDPSIFTRLARTLQELFFAHGGSLDPQTREPVIGGEIETVAQRLIDIVDAYASGAFVPN